MTNHIDSLPISLTISRLNGGSCPRPPTSPPVLATSTKPPPGQRRLFHSQQDESKEPTLDIQPRSPLLSISEALIALAGQATQATAAPLCEKSSRRGSFFAQSAACPVTKRRGRWWHADPVLRHRPGNRPGFNVRSFAVSVLSARGGNSDVTNSACRLRPPTRLVRPDIGPRRTYCAGSAIAATDREPGSDPPPGAQVSCPCRCRPHHAQV